GRELREVEGRLGKAGVYVTHDQGEALALSDRIVVMSNGRIEQIGSPQEIYERPANAFVADFIGSSNLLEATVVGCDGAATIINAGGLMLRTGVVADTSVTRLPAMGLPERIPVRAAQAADGAPNQPART